MSSKQDEDKMILSAKAREETYKAHSTCVDEFLSEPSANVVGLAEGIKWKNGKPTGEPALLVLVTHKLDKALIPTKDLVPSKLGDMQTDVLAVGHVFAGGCCTASEAGIQTLAKRVRPAQGGYSVGHKNITAGTIATCVYDMLPGGTVSPPKHGIGIPGKYYILSNNHVLANSNAGAIGDAVLQPGPYDGGVDPADRIATLSRYIPITFNPPTPLASQNNLVDCAIAEGQFHDLNREIYWVGDVRGWRLKTNVKVGTIVKKAGRTTNFTTGKITAINATIDVNYGGGKVARLKDQIVTTNMSAGGDSGSLVLTLDNIAVGLLFAGSSTSMIANQIENVRALLRVEVAEQIL
ncbi:MAG: S1 family peptidase [Methylococcaceae bacterium]|nr:S1 family peptidase [Methylococcaceae bacterium]